MHLISTLYFHSAALVPSTSTADVAVSPLTGLASFLGVSWACPHCMKHNVQTGHVTSRILPGDERF